MVCPLKDEAVWAVLYGGLTYPSSGGAGGGSEAYDAVRRMESTIFIQGAGLLRHDL